MNEIRLQNAIWLDRGRQASLVCPGYTPSGWTESDIWLVTKAGYAVEFEIKVSLADFRNDSRKTIAWRESTGPNWWDKKDCSALKHDLLATRDPRGPSRFYFVVPAELGITRDMVPSWAGLITARYQHDHERELKDLPLRIHEEIPAPKLHSQRVPQTTLDHCRSVFFWRYWNLRMRAKSEKWLTEQLEKGESGQQSGGLPDDVRALETQDALPFGSQVGNGEG